MVVKTVLLLFLLGCTSNVAPLEFTWWQTEHVTPSSFSRWPIFDLNASQVQNVTVLKLYCIRNTLEASVWGELLTKFYSLEELWTNSCDVEINYLASLQKLHTLSITHKSIMKLHDNDFGGFAALTNLDLSYNNIGRISLSLFCSSTNFDRRTCNSPLQTLDMSYNEIVELPVNVFVGLMKLQKLYLQNNQIITIHEKAFIYLYDLKVLNLSSNALTTLPSSLFEFTGKIKYLFLKDNSLAFLHKGVLRTLNQLERLDLSLNKLTNEWANNDPLTGLSKLLVLNLSNNNITEIDSVLLSNIKNLQFLSLEYNKINRIADNALTSLKNLRSFTLAHNDIAEINGIFSDTQCLLWLNVSKNKLKQFDYSDVPCTLQWLYIHDNNITKLEDRNNVRENHDIKVLDISYNKLESINEFSFPSKIENVVLNNNNIERIFPGTFFGKHKLREVILHSNKLKTLEVGAISLSPQINATTTPRFYLSDNPFECDCNLEWLKGANQFYNNTQCPVIMDLEDITCNLKTKANISLTELSLDFLCQYESYCPFSCTCCGFMECYCELICPDNCICYRDFTWNKNIVDCSRAKYDFIPKNIPTYATEIRLDGNNLIELKDNIFLGKFILQILYINNSNIAIVNNKTFNSLKSLEVLHLENNYLKQLNVNMFKELVTLQQVFLNDNKIRKLENGTFRVLPALKFLNLDNNGNVDFMPWLIGYNKDTHVSLDRIYWICDCQDLKLLNQWLLLNVTENIMCYLSDGKSINTTITTVSKECEIMSSTNIRILLGVLIPLIVILGIVIVSWCVYKKKLSTRQEYRVYRGVAVSNRTQDDETL